MPSSVFQLTFNQNQRITRPELYIVIARLMGLRKTCPRAKGGTVITVDNRIVTTGYAGAPAGMAHCIDVGCQIDNGDPGCKRTVHAEVAAITFAARIGISLDGGTLYTTYNPCLDCAKAIINSGIAEVVYELPYRNPQGIELLRMADVVVKKWPDEFPDDSIEVALDDPELYL